MNLDQLLPCVRCSENYREHLSSPRLPSLDSVIEAASLQEGSRALFDWTVELHNLVNHSLGKPYNWRADAAERALASALSPPKPISLTHPVILTTVGALIAVVITCTTKVVLDIKRAGRA